MKLTKTGEPRIGQCFVLPTVNNGDVPVRVVAKFYGNMGTGDLVSILVEDVEHPGPPLDLTWPLERLDGTPINPADLKAWHR